MRDRSRPLLVVVLAILATMLLLPNAAAAAQAVTDRVLAQQDSGARVRGTVRGPDGPLADVTITVSQDGEAVGEAVTDDGGGWAVDLPAAGTYTVAIDQDGLPDGLGVREPEQFATQQIEVAAGENKGVLFPIVAAEGGAGGPRWLGRLLQLTVAGLRLGAIIAITSVGLSLIFGVTGLVNFAHGELVTIGAVSAYWFHVGPGGRRLSLIVAAVLAMLIGAGTGAVLEKGIFAPLRKRKAGLIALLVITIGLSFFIRHLILVFYGGGPEKYIDYAVQRDPLTLGPITLVPRDLSVMLISVALLVAVGLLLQKTKLGTAMRAVADNRDLAESSGIDVKKVILSVWILGGALAAIGGVFQGLTVGGVEWDMGFALLLLMFAGTIVGGIGTAYGAMAGGLLVGMVSEVSTLWLSVELKLVLAFLALIIVLLVRPQGILGKRERLG